VFWAFQVVEHLLNVNLLYYSGISVRACSGAFQGVPVCSGAVLVVFRFCFGRVRVCPGCSIYAFEAVACEKRNGLWKLCGIYRAKCR